MKSLDNRMTIVSNVLSGGFTLYLPGEKLGSLLLFLSNLALSSLIALKMN